MTKPFPLRRMLAALAFLVVAAPAWAGDFRADIETVLRHMGDDPDAVFVFEMDGSPSIAVQGETASIRIDGLKAVPKANRTASALTIGTVTAHIKRREDGGLAMTIDLPSRMPFHNAADKTDSEIGIEDGHMTLEWGKDLAETDAVEFSTARATVHDAGKGDVTLRGLMFRQRRGDAGGRDGSFAMRLEGLEDPAQKTAPVSFVGWGPLELSGRYENFPHDLYRDQARYMMLWEAARLSRGDTNVNLGLAAQGGALMQEAQTRYQIERIEFKTPMLSARAEGDFHFSLEASRGVFGTMTAWVSETGKADLGNPMMMAAGLLASRFGEQGKTPEGEPARVFRMALAADGSATLNGEPAPGLAAGIGNAFKTLSLTMNGFAPPRQQPVSLVAGATGCGVPVYPAASLTAKESGRTILNFFYDESGALQLTSIKSSGFSRLDEAARLAFISCRFAKGTAEAHIPVDWKIDDGRGTVAVGGGLTTVIK